MLLLIKRNCLSYNGNLYEKGQTVEVDEKTARLLAKTSGGDFVLAGESPASVAAPVSDFEEISGLPAPVAADVTDVFINADEFAEEHNLNDVICDCVVQSPTARESFLNQTKYDKYVGIQGKLIFVHVAKDNLSEVPGEGQRFDLDGEILTVASVIDDMGMLTIELHGENINGGTY